MKLQGRLSPGFRGLSDPIDGASLAVFRIGYGSIIVWEVWRAFDSNLIRADYDLPKFMFHWWLFQWVRPLPGVWIYIAFVALGIAAALLALGLFSRIAAAFTALGIAYWFLMEKAAYLNHRYLAIVLGALLVVVPADAVWSASWQRRARRRARRSQGASRVTTVHRGTVPGWCLALLRFQVGVPYFFGGIAKLNYDWLIRAEPLRASLAAHGDFPLLGRFFDNALLTHTLALGSVGLDLFVPFLMLYRRTRVAAFGFALAFHFINSRIYEIGIFPWLMIVGSTLFFEPDWPRRMQRSLRTGGRARAATITGFIVGFALGAFLPEEVSIVRGLVGALGVGVFAFHAFVQKPPPDTPQKQPAVLRRRVGAALAAWTLIQIALPLTHFAIPGNAYWTEERNRFSWHMLVRVKHERVRFLVTDPASDRTWVEDLNRHLTRYQISKLEVPDLVLEFAHHLDAFYKDRGLKDVEVRVDSVVSLNGRRPQRAIDPDIDLTEVARPYVPPADWIRPLRPFRSTPEKRARR